MYSVIKKKLPNDHPLYPNETLWYLRNHRTELDSFGCFTNEDAALVKCAELNLLEQIQGKSVDEARKLLEVAGLSLRISNNDGKRVVGTGDYDPQRRNFVVINDTIVTLDFIG